MAKVLVLRTAGVNCDEETAHAFRLAGGEVSVRHVGSLLRGEDALDDFDILAIPGGFSYGDDLGAGTVLANQLRTRLADDLHAFVDGGKLVDSVWAVAVQGWVDLASWLVR
jgi:phosphoribosylformylglycinamidine synthase